jgi:hypothetical protein
VEHVTVLTEVGTFPTQRGSVRYVARDEEGNEYTTFREEIGERARQLEGKRVRLEYHEERRDRYQNVYLDRAEPAEPASPEPGADTDPQEAAWRTAVAAAPWLAGAPEQEVPPDKLYRKLKPFEQRVAADIEEARRGRYTGSGDG